MTPAKPSPDQGARRAAIQQQLTQHGRLTMVQRRVLAAQFGCTPAIIGHDIAALKQPPRTQAPAVLSVSSMIDQTDERETAVLRALGRLEVMTSAQIQALLFPDVTAPTMRARLRALVRNDFIWQTTTTMPTIAPPEAVRGRRPPPLKAPFIYGLTNEGKAYLDTLDVEAHAPSFARLKSRDRRSHDIPRQQLTHDLLASSWCCSVIDAARRCSLLVDIQCQVEYVSATDERGKELQRFDAYLALRFTRKQRPQTMPGWWLPWYDGEADTDQDVTVRYALEIDRGTEKLAILMAKAYMYHTLTQKGHYTETLGGPVMPVVLVPPGRRAGQVALEWQAAWPKGMGIVSTPIKANHPQHGAIWGEYLTLTDSPTKPIRLLGNLFSSVESWENLTRDWVPGTPQTKETQTARNNAHGENKNMSIKNGCLLW